jgi:hypothetical protein
MVDIDIQVPVTYMGRIEDAHMIVCHMSDHNLTEER